MITPAPLSDILDTAIACAIVDPSRREEIRFLLWTALYGASGLGAQGALYQFDERVNAVVGTSHELRLAQARDELASLIEDGPEGVDGRAHEEHAASVRELQEEIEALERGEGSA